jgi:hypothetical protein
MERADGRMAEAIAAGNDLATLLDYVGQRPSGKIEDLDGAIARFALTYERQTNQDHGALDKACSSGRIRVASSEVVK